MLSNTPKIVGIYCVIRAILYVVTACNVLTVASGFMGGSSYFTSAFLFSLAAAVVSTVIASGLFQAKSWAWTGTMVYFGIEAGLTVVSWCSRSTLHTDDIVYLVIAVVILYAFSQDQVKQALGRG